MSTDRDPALNPGPILADSNRMMAKDWLSAVWALLVLTLSFGLGLGCAGLSLAPERHYTYFETPAPSDAWSAKIAGWQRRERADSEPTPLDTAPARVSGPGRGVAITPAAGRVDDRAAAREPGAASPLREKYDEFRTERRRAMARDLAAWIQSQAKQHYIADGPIDHWATFEETMRSNGDDCDGLELLTFHALRELGFGEDEVFRAVVYRPSDGQHHMVTLWFEDEHDPWVIDPTGAMTTGMPRMSELRAWVPLKVFSDEVEFSVAPRSIGFDAAARFAHN